MATTMDGGCAGFAGATNRSPPVPGQPPGEIVLKSVIHYRPRTIDMHCHNRHTDDYNPVPGQPHKGPSLLRTP